MSTTHIDLESLVDHLLRRSFDQPMFLTFDETCLVAQVPLNADDPVPSLFCRTVDTHMRRLREKLGDAARYLDTVRGVGYRFVEN